MPIKKEALEEYKQIVSRLTNEQLLTEFMAKLIGIATFGHECTEHKDKQSCKIRNAFQDLTIYVLDKEVNRRNLLRRGWLNDQFTASYIENIIISTRLEDTKRELHEKFEKLKKE